MASSSITPSAAGLRALSHPTRLKMLMLLRLEGPATATQLAQQLKLNTGATSYHLRQLAEHGFIDEDHERGDARDRWWKAAHQSTHADLDLRTSDEEAESSEAYLHTVALMYTETLMQYAAERRFLPAPWRSASTTSDWHLRLTAARAEQLVDRADRGHRPLGRRRGRRRHARRRPTSWSTSTRSPVPAPSSWRETTDDRSRRPPHPRRVPLYGWLTAEAISLLGTRVSMIAIPWLVLTTTGSPTQTGLVAFAEITPMVLFKAFGGPLVDRVGPAPDGDQRRHRCPSSWSG